MPSRPLHRHSILAAASLVVASLTGGALAIPAFPGAEGAGSNATGGRGGDVYYVTSLADTNTAGTLRNAISSAPAAGRTILFKVGGTINLASNLDFNKPNLTIAGQSAPGDGITIAQRMTRIVNTNNVVLRNLRFRVGNVVTRTTDADYEPDALWVANSGNVMVDHVSASWSVDETLSVTHGSTNVSVQWSNISESLRDAGHSKGAHGYGSLINGGAISYHHNLYAHHDSRNPRPGTWEGGTLNFDFRNNVVYDWGGQAGYNGDEAGVVNMNFVGNYLVAGPATLASKVNNAFRVGLTETHVYQSGNKIDGDRDALRDGVDTGWAMFTGTPVKLTTPHATAHVTTQTADAAYESVLTSAGARWWNRDAVDVRVFSSVRNGTGGLINSEVDVGGWPTLAAGIAPLDTDVDGMPDAWERARGLNVAVKNHNADFDADGYTDLEEYLNELAAWPAPRPIVFNGATTGSTRYALSGNWDIHWQPSRFDAVQINSGVATIDAVSQDAGSITLGASGISTNTLAINSGWLRVTNDLTIGGGSIGNGSTLLLNGGTLVVGGSIAGAGTSARFFTWDGGTLVASRVDATLLRNGPGAPQGTLRQSGGTIAPGDAGVAGRTSIVGAYSVDAAATTQIELGGAAAATGFQSITPAFDNLTVSGVATVGGRLNLSLIGGYDPALLAPHTILTAASVGGHYAGVSGHQVGANKWLAVTYTPTGVIVTAATPGDANVNGAVGFDDLLALAQHYGQTSGQSWADGDFTGNGAVEFDDLLTLAQRYGNAPAAVIGDAQFAADWALAQSLVPEPAMVVVASVGAGCFMRRRLRYDGREPIDHQRATARIAGKHIVSPRREGSVQATSRADRFVTL